MDTIQAYFTKRPYNPGSLLIRAANPVSLLRIAPVSHVVVIDSESGYAMEASMLHGVRRAAIDEVLTGLTIVQRVSFQVPDAEAGLAWMRATAERKAKYDFKGAFGLGLAPDRDWQEDDDWFCFEYVANGLAKAGRDTFANHARVTGYMLMSLVP